MIKTDFLIAGAGFAGIVLAERISTQLNKTCLIVEKRNHIGGNAYDEYDHTGVLLHKYGPHYFRTNSIKVKKYLSKFTEWRHVNYEIKSFSDGVYWNFPINLNTFEQFIGRRSTSEEMKKWIEKNRVSIDDPKNSEEVIISQVGWELYNKFFKGYTLKQWKMHPKELDATVCGRIPIRTNRDNRYIEEKFQALPQKGYHNLFENMIDACDKNVEIILEKNYKEIINSINYHHLIFTGPIDEYYDSCFGSLQYRSLRFKIESYSANELIEREKISGNQKFWQPALQVNYPNDFEFTRIVEIKHATGQKCKNTTIVKEYPDDFKVGKEPFYPVPSPQSSASYIKYKEIADKESNVTFIGRLAKYRYLNMDQVVDEALIAFERIKQNVLK